MRWVPDTTGRVQKRPHYSLEYLDSECEKIVSEFLRDKRERVEFPISTDDLTCLLERDVEFLDPYANLSDETGRVEGVTEFRFGRKPIVKIAAALMETPYMENRLRTTLTHEYGHVRFHDFLYQAPERPMSLFENLNVQESSQTAHRCKRDSMVSLDDRDWMEWQAGFVCGAMLIPITPLLKFIKASRQRLNMEHTAIYSHSTEGMQLITDVAQAFQTSKDAARVRLIQQKFLSSGATGSLL